MFVPTLNMLISNSVRIAFVKAIWEGHSSNITHQCWAIDIFFTNIPVINKFSARILLRLITTMPQTTQCKEILQESAILA